VRAKIKRPAALAFIESEGDGRAYGGRNPDGRGHPVAGAQAPANFAPLHAARRGFPNIFRASFFSKYVYLAVIGILILVASGDEGGERRCDGGLRVWIVRFSFRSFAKGSSGFSFK
jgi:hypothetical protein